MRIIIEAEAEGDYKQITRVHTMAFNGDREARLVEKLRKTPNYIPELSLVAKYPNVVIGHVLLYPIRISTRRKKKCISLALAPVSVISSFQNRKVGSRLIKEGLKRALKLGFKSVIVIGHPRILPKIWVRESQQIRNFSTIRCPR